MRSLMFAVLAVACASSASTSSKADGPAPHRSAELRLPAPQPSVDVRIERGVRVWRPIIEHGDSDDQVGYDAPSYTYVPSVADGPRPYVGLASGLGYGGYGYGGYGYSRYSDHGGYGYGYGGYRGYGYNRYGGFGTNGYAGLHTPGYDRYRGYHGGGAVMLRPTGAYGRTVRIVAPVPFAYRRNTAGLVVRMNPGSSGGFGAPHRATARQSFRAAPSFARGRGGRVHH